MCVRNEVTELWPPVIVRLLVPNLGFSNVFNVDTGFCSRYHCPFHTNNSSPNQRFSHWTRSKTVSRAANCYCPIVAEQFVFYRHTPLTVNCFLLHFDVSLKRYTPVFLKLLSPEPEQFQNILSALPFREDTQPDTVH